MVKGHKMPLRGQNENRGVIFRSLACLSESAQAKSATFVQQSGMMNIDFGRKLPGYLTEKNNIITHILFTAGFALLFINLYTPFGVTTWFDASKPMLFVYSSVVILFGMLIIALSRIIMYQAVRRGMEIVVWQYLVWIAAEIVAMAFFFVIYQKVRLKDPRMFVELLGNSFLGTALTLLLPYSMLWLYFSWHDSKKKLTEIIEQPDVSGQRPMVALRDEKGVLRISLKRSDILYLQGSDNYVTVWYQAQDRVMKFMLRNTLRVMEDELKPESIIRCHRSWLVNMGRVKLIRREKEGLTLELDSNPPSTVPVSRTYMHSVLTAFGQES